MLGDSRWMQNLMWLDHRVTVSLWQLIEEPHLIELRVSGDTVVSAAIVYLSVSEEDSVILHWCCLEQWSMLYDYNSSYIYLTQLSPALTEAVHWILPCLFGPVPNRDYSLDLAPRHDSVGKSLWHASASHWLTYSLLPSHENVGWPSR